MKTNTETQKKIKPSFDEFIGRIDSVIAETPSKKQVSKAYGLLKQGFNNTLKDEHIESICNRFFIWNQFPLVAFKITLAVSCGPRQTELIKRLSREIRKKSGRLAEFPFENLPLFTNITDTERKNILKDWVLSKLDKSEDVFEWARHALICMLNEELTEGDYEIIRLIAKSICTKKEHRKKTGNKFAKYVLEICSPFADRKVKVSKLVKLFDLTSLFESRNVELERRLKELKIELEDLDEKNKSDQEQLASTLDELRFAKEETKSLKQELDLRSELLRIEAEKLGSSEKHWKHELERQLAGITFSIKKKISHEVNEAKLALDCDRPDLEMALSRLRKIEDELGKVETKWEKE